MMDGMHTVTLRFPDPDCNVKIRMEHVPRVGEHIVWQGETDWRVTGVTWGLGTRGLKWVSLNLKEF